MAVDPVRPADQVLDQVSLRGLEVAGVVLVAALEERAALDVAPEAQVVDGGGLDPLAAALDHAAQGVVRNRASASRLPRFGKCRSEARMAPDVQEELSLVHAEVQDASGWVSVLSHPDGLIAEVLHVPTSHGARVVLAGEAVREEDRRTMVAEGQVEVPRCDAEEFAALYRQEVREGVAVDVPGELLEGVIACETAEVDDLIQAGSAAGGRPLVDFIHNVLDKPNLGGRRVLLPRVAEREVGGRVRGRERKRVGLLPVNRK
mmetsp:Transcript_2590/g.7270  ORF Transcript_2590/g.7270 Transcript_2590/m.7270 type:complete len:261 (+) Transcript_2590:142-924(+)